MNVLAIATSTLSYKCTPYETMVQRRHQSHCPGYSWILLPVQHFMAYILSSRERPGGTGKSTHYKSYVRIFHLVALR